MFRAIISPRLVFAPLSLERLPLPTTRWMRIRRWSFRERELGLSVYCCGRGPESGVTQVPSNGQETGPFPREAGMCRRHQSNNRRKQQKEARGETSLCAKHKSLLRFLFTRRKCILARYLRAPLSVDIFWCHGAL